MCQAGVPETCGICFVDAVATYREELRGGGNEIVNWGDNIDHFGQRRTGQQLHTSGKHLIARAEEYADLSGPDAARRIGGELQELGGGLAEPFGGV